EVRGGPGRGEEGEEARLHHLLHRVVPALRQLQRRVPRREGGGALQALRDGPPRQGQGDGAQQEVRARRRVHPAHVLPLLRRRARRGHPRAARAVQVLLRREDAGLGAGGDGGGEQEAALTAECLPWHAKLTPTTSRNHKVPRTYRLAPGKWRPLSVCSEPRPPQSHEEGFLAETTRCSRRSRQPRTVPVAGAAV